MRCFPLISEFPFSFGLRPSFTPQDSHAKNHHNIIGAHRHAHKLRMPKHQTKVCLQGNFIFQCLQAAIYNIHFQIRARKLPNRCTNTQTHTPEHRMDGSTPHTHTHTWTERRHTECPHANMIPLSNKKKQQLSSTQQGGNIFNQEQVRQGDQPWYHQLQSVSSLVQDWMSCLHPLRIEVLHLFRRCTAESGLSGKQAIHDGVQALPPVGKDPAH